MATITLKRYDKTKHSNITLPNNASGSNSVYLTEDLRFVIFKMGSEWGWYALKETFYNDLGGVSRYDTTKTSCVDTIQRLVDEEEHDEKLWKE